MIRRRPYQTVFTLTVEHDDERPDYAALAQAAAETLRMAFETMNHSGKADVGAVVVGLHIDGRRLEARQLVRQPVKWGSS